MKQKLLLTFALLLTAVTGAWADPTWLQPGDEWEEGSKTLTVKSNPVNDAYQGITEIENVNFAASVTSIGDRAFGYCTNLASVTIPDGVTSIGSNAFDGCSSLMSVDIPNSVTSIGSNAFSHTGLTSIDINVMMIGNGAFDGCTNLTTVNIGSKVSTIGNNPFAGCTKLSTINVASGNTKYDSRDNCNAIIDKNLNTLVVGCKGTTIPNSVTSIGSYAFLDSGLTSITLPASVTSIGMNAFYVCSSLASVTVYATTPPTLGDDAFYGCDDDLQIYVFSDYVGAYTTDPDWGVYSSKITAMTGGYCGTTGHESDVVWVLTGTTPNYTLTISGSGAMADYYGVNQPWYSNRTSISSIVIEDGVTRIGNNAFDGCNNVSLASVTLPASVTEIGRYAFNNCTNLATVTFASGSQLTSIGLYAFLNSGLTSITIPASVTSIGMQAFYGCSNLATVSGCEGVTNVGSNAFSNTEWLTNQPTGVIYIGKVAYYGKNVSGVVSINTGTVSVSAEAFKNCTGLTAVSIPASVTSIGDGAFNYCTSLATVTFASGSQLTSIGGDAFSITGLTSITIPASVETIGDGAFSYCTNLANITVDENNTHFDSRDNCNAIIDKNLNKLVVGCKGTTIPNTVTSIGSSAFVGSGLTSITIPASVASIGNGAFRFSNSLASVTVYASDPPSLGSSVFNSCNNLDYIYVFSDLVGTYKGATRWNAYQSIITAIPNQSGNCGAAGHVEDVTWELVLTSTTGVLTISGTDAMEEFSGPNFQPWKDYRTFITSVIIEDGVTSIGDYAFDGCTGLTSVTIGSGVTTIGDYTFLGCNNASLTSITIPASVTSIGQDAFENCTYLATVTFASGSLLTSISPSAFTCTGLTTIEIPAKVTTIGSSAFYHCTSLATVTFADGSLLETIDFGAFYQCTNLSSITLPNGMKTIDVTAFSDCTSLTSITIPASVTNIGMNAFDGCNNLGTVTLNSNPYIGIGAFDNIKAGATVTMNLTANSADEKYWMTFYNENYNFQADANTQVFKAALSDTKVSLTELTTDKIVNKDNAVLLKSTASPIVMTLTSTNSENDFTGNALNGVSDPAGKTDDGYMYVLNYTAANGVGFYKLATGSKLGVGKAYLSYSGGGASNFFGLDDDGTTSIDVRSKMEEVRGDGLYYDLNGRRVMNPTKGIYIVNGKKVLLK